MTFDNIINHSEIPNESLVYFTTQENMNEYLQKKNPNYDDFQKMHLFIAMKREILNSKLYQKIKDINVTQATYTRKEEGVVVIVDKCDITKDEAHKMLITATLN